MFFLPGFPAGLYSAPEDIPGGAGENGVMLTQSSEQVIYDIYDGLAAAYPQFVTKQVMAQVGDRKINRYTFSNYPLINASEFAVQPLKICIVTSLHGYEQGCAWTAAQFFRLMCENPTDPHLGFLRRNVVFDVIPVANPWGFAHNARKNANGVDLNRNFSEDFYGQNPPESTEYGGPHPFSEIETQTLKQFIAENMDAQAVLDYHNIGKGYPLFYVYQQKDVQLAYGIFAALSEKWQAQYPAFPTDRLLGRVRPNGHEGMFADHLRACNLWALTMETPWCMPDIGTKQYDAPTIRCALDMLVNTILAIVQKC